MPNQYPHLTAALQRLTQDKKEGPHYTDIDDVFQRISYPELTLGETAWNENELTAVAINALNQGNEELFKSAVNAGAVLNKNPTSYYDDLVPTQVKLTYSALTFADPHRISVYLNAGGNLFLSLPDSPKLKTAGGKKDFSLLNILTQIVLEKERDLLPKIISAECLFQAFEHSMVNYPPEDTQLQLFYTHIFTRFLDFSPDEKTFNAQQLNTMSKLHPLPLSVLLGCVRGFFGNSKGVFKANPLSSQSYPATTPEQMTLIKNHWKSLLPVFWQEYHLSSDEEYRAQRAAISPPSAQNVGLSRNQERLILESLSVLSGLSHPDEFEFNGSINPSVIQHILKLTKQSSIMPYDETHTNAFALGMIHYLANKTNWQNIETSHLQDTWYGLLISHLTNENTTILSLEWMKNDHESTVDFYSRILQLEHIKETYFTLGMLTTILNKKSLANVLNHWDQVTLEKMNNILHLPSNLNEGNDKEFNSHVEKPYRDLKDAPDLEKRFEDMKSQSKTIYEHLYLTSAYHKAVLHRHICSQPEIYNTFKEVLIWVGKTGQQNTFVESIHQDILKQQIKPVATKHAAPSISRF